MSNAVETPKRRSAAAKKTKSQQEAIVITITPPTEEEFRALLQELNDDLGQFIASQESSDRHLPAGMHLADGHSEEGLDLTYRSARNSGRRRRIIATLKQVYAGRYGFCATCDKQIDPKRMQALPFEAANCYPCQDGLDRKGR